MEHLTLPKGIHETHTLDFTLGVWTCSKCWYCTCHWGMELVKPCSEKWRKEDGSLGWAYEREPRERAMG